MGETALNETSKTTCPLLLGLDTVFISSYQKCELCGNNDFCAEYENKEICKNCFLNNLKLVRDTDVTKGASS